MVFGRHDSGRLQPQREVGDGVDVLVGEVRADLTSGAVPEVFFGGRDDRLQQLDRLEVA